jgi:antitoxin ParD1/3/4
MSKNTSIILSDYYNDFISQQVQLGKFSSTSEVVRAALRLFEFEEKKKETLLLELKKGEESGFVENFNTEEFLKRMRAKHLK